MLAALAAQPRPQDLLWSRGFADGTDDEQVIAECVHLRRIIFEDLMLEGSEQVE